jgi:hypothetical protein
MGSLRLFLLAEVISSIIWKTVDLSIRMILSFLRSSAEQPVTNISNPEGQSLVCETDWHTLERCNLYHSVFRRWRQHRT